MKTKTIVVCGDLVWDTHIARLPWTGLGYYEPNPNTQLANRPGGAWYLRDMITAALVEGAKPEPGEENWEDELKKIIFSPAKAKHEDIESKNCPAGIARACSVWNWFEGVRKPAAAKLVKEGSVESIWHQWPEGEAEPGAWRITEFLGCQAARWEGAPAGPAIENEPENPQVLVIDDLGLGFAKHKDSWPRCLKNPPKSLESIIIKATPPFDTAIWDTLLTKGVAERVSVVISAAALRDFGVQLTKGLSWDHTIEEVQREFSTGGTGFAFRECRRVVVLFGRSGAAVFSRVARCPDEEKNPPAALQFERFSFDPSKLEGTWSEELDGATFGAASAMTAVLACHEMMPKSPSSHLSVSRGLAAARAVHRIGGGSDPAEMKVHAADERAFDFSARPEAAFKSAFPRELLDEPVLVAKDALPKPSLLTDVLGDGSDFLTVAAQDIVRLGRNRPLAAVPRLSCRKFFTVDREEVETLNMVRNLIQDYRQSKDTRPLSLAVFGAPGSGKSFAIEQLAEQLFGRSSAVLKFNLSQFRDVDDLHDAFHEVRDKSVKGQMPLVFWDEFDSKRDGELGWLKEFLAPMQDANFHARGKEHPFGRCIFIFAGGTSPTFQKFDRSADEKDKDFKTAKGPDFVSRLRGYVNIKGPNPLKEKGDEVHVIRRALILRLLIERHHPHIMHPETKKMGIDPKVLDAFLRVKEYRHGARSMEAIVSLCRLSRSHHLGPSELPPPEVVNLHVSDDFSAIVRDTTRFHLSPGDVERLAEIKHEQWRKEKEQKGFVHGEKRNDDSTPKTHPLMKDYRELSEGAKEGNRLPARLTVLRLDALGYRIAPKGRNSAKQDVEVTIEDLTKLAQSEHRRWMREKLLDGVAYGEKTEDGMGLHQDIRKFKDLQDCEQRLDHAIIRGILEFLKEKRLCLVRSPCGDSGIA